MLGLGLLMHFERRFHSMTCRVFKDQYEDSLKIPKANPESRNVNHEPCFTKKEDELFPNSPLISLQFLLSPNPVTLSIQGPYINRLPSTLNPKRNYLRVNSPAPLMLIMRVEGSLCAFRFQGLGFREPLAMKLD